MLDLRRVHHPDVQIFLGHTASVTRVKLQQVARSEMVCTLEVTKAIPVLVADTLPLSTRLGRLASWLDTASVFAIKARTFAAAWTFSTDKASLTLGAAVARTFPLVARILNGAAVVGSDTLERPIWCRFTTWVLLQQPAVGLACVMASLHLRLGDPIENALGLYLSPSVKCLKALLQQTASYFASSKFPVWPFIQLAKIWSDLILKIRNYSVLAEVKAQIYIFSENICALRPKDFFGFQNRLLLKITLHAEPILSVYNLRTSWKARYQ